jgi:hypothetical protein
VLLATGAIRWLTFSGFWVAGCHFAGEAVFDPGSLFALSRTWRDKLLYPYPFVV